MCDGMLKRRLSCILRISSIFLAGILVLLLVFAICQWQIAIGAQNVPLCIHVLDAMVDSGMSEIKISEDRSADRISVRPCPERSLSDSF